MYSHTICVIHLTHELILCIQITSGKVEFVGDSTVKVFAGTEVRTCHLPDLRFAAVTSF